MSYVAIIISLVSVTALLIYLSDKFEFIGWTTKNGDQIPFFKYFVLVISFYLLLVITSVAIEINNNEAYGLGNILGGFYHALMYIMIFLATMFIIGLIYGVLVYIGVLAGKVKDDKKN